MATDARILTAFHTFEDRNRHSGVHEMSHETVQETDDDGIPGDVVDTVVIRWKRNSR